MGGEKVLNSFFQEVDVKIRFGLIFSVLFLMTGCFPSVTQVIQKPEYKNSTSFNIGKEQIASVGEPMIVEEDLYFYNGLVTTADFQQPSQFGVTYPVIKEGTNLKLYGTLSNGDKIYEILNEEKARDLYGNPVQWSYCLAVNNEGHAYGTTPCSMVYVVRWPEPVDIFKEAKVYQKGTFKMELLYNGKNKDNIRVTYREFTDNFARPAFTQELLYDLAESKTIAFKKMRIDVIEATNSHIKFIVHSTMK